MEHWWYIAPFNNWRGDYWLFAWSFNLAVNFAIWALFIWMAKNIVFSG